MACIPGQGLHFCRTSPPGCLAPYFAGRVCGDRGATQRPLVTWSPRSPEKGREKDPRPTLQAQRARPSRELRRRRTRILSDESEGRGTVGPYPLKPGYPLSQLSRADAARCRSELRRADAALSWNGLCTSGVVQPLKQTREGY